MLYQPFRPHYILSTLLVLFGMVATITLAVQGELSEYLFAQLSSTAAPTTTAKQFAWTPGAGTTLGNQTLTVTATDAEGNITTESIPITILAEQLAFTLPPTVNVTDTQVTITWNTTADATGHVDFDISPNTFRETVDDTAGTRRSSHSVTLTHLTACTTYSIRAVAAGLTVQATDATRTLTTTGCPGNAAVAGITRGDMVAQRGGTVSLTNKIDVVAPAAFASSDVTWQIHQLDRAAALTALGTPTGLSPVTGLYQVSVFQNTTTPVTTFNQPVSLTVAYTPTADTDVSTLALYRHNGSAWSRLEGCTVASTQQKVTCTTTSFSAVAGFSSGSGSPEPSSEPSPTPQPQSGSGSSNGGGGGGSGGGGGGGDDSSSTPAQPTKPVGKPSPVPLSALNAIIKRVLGQPFITPDIRSYYIWRLQRGSNESGYIKNVSRLEATMKYWKTLNPTRPRGKIPSTAIARSDASAVASGTVSVAQLNNVIRRILGPQFLTPDIRQYYVNRLTAPATHPQAIRGLDKLESVMRYWKAARPARPRGG